MKFLLAGEDCIDELAELFDQYRVFYQQPSDLEGAKNFLRARFMNKDSIIYTAGEQKRLSGFIQMYPCHSSVGMGPVWILNDLYVEKSSRGKGVARRLMETGKTHALKTGALRIELATEIKNTAGQKLYESLGYCRNETFYRYNLPMHPEGR